MCSPVLDANDVSLIIIGYIKIKTFCTRFELKIDVVLWSTWSCKDYICFWIRKIQDLSSHKLRRKTEQDQEEETWQFTSTEFIFYQIRKHTYLKDFEHLGQRSDFLGKGEEETDAILRIFLGFKVAALNFVGIVLKLETFTSLH